ncbi:MAG: GIY-YIG nuclease family protein [Hyphomicrobiales bacterium]|nr:GIY-YIG nuclease family protein [Hyphomicrobiales bacterium]MBV8440498.1 GIY-YIG nuclease family protein [Hyphomicrobiales bacterium]
MTGQAGYVYVLLTGYTDKTGVPLVKIGCTSRTPDHRNREISRGGPVGTTVVGAVTTRNMVALERKAHQAFLRVRFIGDGGTEYFVANPDEVLAWLRAETPRFEIESARNSAWREYVESPPWKAKSGVWLTGFTTFMVFWGGGSFWLLGQHVLWMLLVMPVIAGVVGLGVWFCLKSLFLYNVEAELKAMRSTLEEKYNLPPDILLSGPTAGYKHRG